MGQHKQSVAIIGVGPYSWHNHLLYLKKRENPPHFVVDLESQKNVVNAVLSAFGFQQTTLLSVPDIFRNSRDLSPEIEKKLDHLIDLHKTTHVILACEPSGRLG